MNLLESIHNTQILLERNIANSSEVDAFITSSAERARQPAAKKWVNTTFRKWVINVYPNISAVSNVPPNAEEWLKQAIERGDDVVNVSLSEKLRNLIDHIVDFLNDYEQRTGKTQINMSVDDAQAAAKAWVVEMNKQVEISKEKEETGISVIFEFPDGHRWVSVESDAALGREGKRMGHCVGSYASEVKSGQIYIWSLRDSNNLPHATLEFSTKSKSIFQLKGKRNAPPIAKYVPYFLELCTQKKLKVSPRGWEDVQAMSPTLKRLKDGQILDLAYSKGIIKMNLLLNKDSMQNDTTFIGRPGGELTLDGHIKYKPSVSSELIFPLNNLTISGDFVNFTIANDNSYYRRQTDDKKVLTTTLPYGTLKVDGDLDLSGFRSITRMPQRLVVGGDFHMSKLMKGRFPVEVIVKGNVYIPSRLQDKITVPDNVKVHWV